ncbi:mevalonate kinase-like [Polyergus mexicanus]|uniref:mevalonate kinase-like n=1 Tax=Polyergus mexicanus TaxID=615972 RepID=UPI0038B61D00
MIKFKISAPGRIALCGEHTSIYGKEIVLASIDRRTTLEFYELNNDARNIINIKFPDIGLGLNIPLALVLRFISDDNFIHVVEDNAQLLRDVQYFITSNGLWKTYPQRFSLQTFFFLLLYIAHHEKIVIKPFRVHLTTKLPIGAGLGSSTSFAVCLAACFLHWARLQKGISNNKFSSFELAQISKYASCCKEVLQNFIVQNDSDICTYGKIIRFRYGGQQLHDTKIINIPSEMNILLINSKFRQNKNEQINQMAEMKHYFPSTVNIVLNKLDRVSNKICCMLVAVNNNYRNGNFLQSQQSYTALSIFIQLHQQMLCYLGLSHPKLNIICLIAQHYGFAGKLTGSGGYAYILPPPDLTNAKERILGLIQHLKAENFIVSGTVMCCNGVRIED